MNDVNAEAQSKRRLWIVGGIVLAAIVAVAVIIAVTSGGDSGSTSSTPAASTGASTSKSGLNGVAAVTKELQGIPQSGNTLGDPNAPATLMVFADMQCPFCAEFENNAMPQIVERYVRPGKLKIVFQPIAILGNDSVLGARAVASAAQQNKMFDYAAILYRNQGEENTGYLNQDYVKKIAAGTPGVDQAKLVSQLKAKPVNDLLNNAQSIATQGKISSTPSFFVAQKGTALRPIQVTELTPEAFFPGLDKITG